MEECLCGVKALYVCKPCKAIFCNEHKTVHENGKQRIHIFEKIGKKLRFEQQNKIICDILSKLQVVNKCEKLIIDETIRLMAKIQKLHMQALDIIKQKQQRYTMLLINCRKRLRDDQLNEIEQELMKSLVIKDPSSQKFKESFNFYKLEFLQETQKIDQIGSMPLYNALNCLKEDYGLFLETHGDTLRGIEITNDNSHIVSLSVSSIIFWNLQTRTQVACLKPYDIQITCMAITSDCKFIISGCYDSTVRIWSFQERTCVDLLEGHSDIINSVAVSRDNAYIASASRDTTVIIWSLNHRQPASVLRGHTLGVMAVIISRDNKYIVSSSEDMTVRVWDLQQGIEETQLKGHYEIVTSIAITSDNLYVVSGSFDRTFIIWNLKDKRGILSFLVGTYLYPEVCIAITNYDQYIISGSSSGLRIWNIQEEVESVTDRGWVTSIARMFTAKYRRETTKSIMLVAITNDNEYIVTGSFDNTIKIVSYKDLKEIGALEGHTFPVTKVGITSDKNYIISADTCKIVRIWNIQYKKHEAVFTDPFSTSEWNLKYPEIGEFFN